jgi:transposase
MPAATPAPSLPEDPAALRAMLLKVLAERDAAIGERDTAVQERDAAVARNEALHHLLLKLRRRQFGRKSERLPEDQLLFAFEEIETTLAEAAAEAARHAPKLRAQQTQRRRANRGNLPAHLQRVEQVLCPERDTCPCCHGALVEIGADTAERLDVIPAQFRVLVTRRPKLACRACPGVVLQAAAPERLVPGGLPTEATVAQVLVARYADHLPLYRQAQMLARQGLIIGREVLADWIGTAAQEIAPVVRRMREILLASPRLFADETTMPVLDPGRGQVKKGFAWAIARDDRPWGGTDPPAVVFRYAPGRGKEHAAALLGWLCAGMLQCDGYAAYKSVVHLAARWARHLAFCWSACAARVLRPGQAAGCRADRDRGAASGSAELYAIEAESPGPACHGCPPGHATRAARKPTVGGGAVRLARGAARAPAGQQRRRRRRSATR